MHPRQASVLAQAKEVATKTATKKTGAAFLWKMTDPDGRTFYLEGEAGERKPTTVKWPKSSFSVKPEKVLPGQLSGQLKGEPGEE